MTEIVKDYPKISTISDAIKRGYSIPYLETSFIEKDVYSDVFALSYNDIKDELEKEFEIKVKKIHEKYESQIFDLLYKALSQVDEDIIEIKTSLKKTLDEIK
jgi:lysine/ornithine N-monooxygenase